MNWDKFPSNLAETLGPIEKKSFVFKYSRFEVWQGGRCIKSENTSGQIIANVERGQLLVKIEDSAVNNYIIRQFSFGEISTNGDRIMWSKDIFNNNEETERNNPDISSLFFQQGVLSKVTFTIHDPNILVEFYPSNFESMNLDFLFKSSSHIRFENGKQVSPKQVGVNRAIKVESKGETYIVTLYNLDGNHPVWQNNIQMAPKQMKIVDQTNNTIILRGFGSDALGASFADYGLSIQIINRQVSKCILHMHDRNVDIEYFSANELKTTEPEIVSISKRANSQFHSENVTDGRQLLIQIYNSIKSNPTQLSNLSDYASVGTSCLLMLDQNLSDDIDTLQMISSVGYLCMSKAIEKDSGNLNLYKNRLLILRIGHEPLVYTVIAGLELSEGSVFSMVGQMAPMRARDAIYKMEIADLELHPQLHQQIPFFNERKEEFDEMIGRQFFLPERTKENIIKSGIENHKKLTEYLDNRILVQGDIDF